MERHVGLASVLLVTAFVSCSFFEQVDARAPALGAPELEVDPFWPKPLPNNWLIGEVPGVAVDSKDHIWIVQRPRSLGPDEAGAVQDPPIALCCVPAPPVIEFDQDGNLIQAWGGPGEGYEWPKKEHGIFVDQDDNVWIGGSDVEDHQVLKFTRDGKFLLQIGQASKTGGSNDTKLLGRPADIAVDHEANEVYVADGYLNRRVIVFDAATGEYHRHWGAYGKKPDESPLGDYDPSGPAPHHFRTGQDISAVHSVVLSKDGLLYVCDRNNNRLQVFQKDGTFVEEVFVAKATLGGGAVWDIDFSSDPQQEFLHIADGTNQYVWILRRAGLETVGKLGRSGRYAGQFHWVHNLAVDSKGNLYTAEVRHGKRVQKFVRQEKASP